jgi:cytochrome b subunit of formate dehydrogenase
MEMFQRDVNPWGQEVLTRISWDLFWAAVVLGALFVVGHQILRARGRKAAAVAATGSAVGVPERVVRHTMVSRLFHWSMAVTMLLLLFSGFMPNLGMQFAWLTLHWVSGLVLIAAILFHIVHASFFQSLRNIWISPGDVKEWFQEMRHAAGSKTPPPRKPGKYPLDHKLYHHAVLVTGFGAMITGVLMMYRVDNPILARDPYMYTDATWGMIYVIHGLSSVGLVFLVISHIYFAVLPEKRWITMSMIFGWITRQKFVEHHDAQRWVPEDAAGSAESTPAPKGARAEAG